MQLCTGKKKDPLYHLGTHGEFIIENFNDAKPLSSFLPAIAGLNGIPMWVFYVNRGQCITSMGINNKDNAILEFFPANRAYQMTPLQGFRTFIKIGRANTLFYEPFRNNLVNSSLQTRQRMIITSYDLRLTDINENIGLQTDVHYFTIPNESFPALGRTVTIKNTSDKKLELHVLDGLPFIISHGLIHIIQKDLSRTAEAWVEVVNTEYNAPLYRLKAVIADKPEVEHIQDGHFYFTFKDEYGLIEHAKPIIDPALIFGQVNDFSYPSEFVKSTDFRTPAHQRSENFTPCAFGFHTFSLKPREEGRIFSMIGHIGSIKKLNSLIRTSISPHYFDKKARENRSVIEKIQDNITTASSSKEFNLYSKQTFLDNVLRGGLPITIGNTGHKKIFHVFSRKHGDLERDYNKFSVLPNPYSQGNGNYRDINQNRRNDVWFNPEVKDSNIITFMNLIQIDGYNPLVIKGSSFTLDNKEAVHTFILHAVKHAGQCGLIKNFIATPFTPGGLLKFIDDKDILLTVSFDEFINEIISHSIKNEESEHGEGFWTDHWTYCLDLIESYLAVYPEKLSALLLEKNDFVFYRNDARVAPRSRRYILRNNKPFQTYAIEGIADQEEFRKKEETMQGIDTDIFKLKTREGAIFQTTLIAKLLCLVANKLATLDPNGIGIEMEGGKPNWYDALNGLPGLFGSSTHETLELKRLILFILKSFDALALKDDYAISLPEELYVFTKELMKLLRSHGGSFSEKTCFEFWDTASTIKEHYRENTAHNISGDVLECSAEELKDFLHKAVAKINLGLSHAYAGDSGVLKSYFFHEVIKYDFIVDKHSKTKLTSIEGYPFIKAKQFITRSLPLFLEGQVHAMKVFDKKQSKDLYESVRLSPLYDRKLKMYKVNASLQNQPEEIGRCRLFTPGWLENESIWLHMQYKYLLEILKNELYDEFYTEFNNVLIPFQNAETYGRSPMENSSFIVSSAYPDASLHGNGFVARLSGATAEFLHIWLLMNIGKNPFHLNEKSELQFTFKPALAGWLFTEEDTTVVFLHADDGDKEIIIPKNSYAFTLFGRIPVVYENPSRKNTFGATGVKPTRIKLIFPDGKESYYNGDTLPEEESIKLRNGEISRINVELFP